MIWQCRNHRFDLNHRPLVMGILNVTPDSFSDSHATNSAAIEHAKDLLEQGADIIDIGGESTRPGSEPVPIQEEMKRVLPVVEALHALFPELALSIDTNKPQVALAAIEKGVSIVNHVGACAGWPGMVELLRQYKVGYVAMHMRGEPKTMQQEVRYSDVLEEVAAELCLVKNGLVSAQISSDQILFDPGIGFGKQLDHNLTLMANTHILADRLERPLLMGVSRKSWMQHLLEIPNTEMEVRDALTASVSACLHQPGVAAHRVHQVLWTKQSLAVAVALRERYRADQKDHD